MLADRASYSAIEAAVPCYHDFINRWRFLVVRSTAWCRATGRQRK
jgi:hypothetical protein